ncbi:hypothetical protein E2C01_001536 [Portunus trituberculatus]|uniref:Uncharacterized protein n=1 Tax=Portunus trituberculatus TaxID=210409 RepID=A0A5B7CHJ3_PORTR|nr:hypothetical protein [Portunus trituberculatus]
MAVFGAYWRDKVMDSVARTLVTRQFRICLDLHLNNVLLCVAFLHGGAEVFVPPVLPAMLHALVVPQSGGSLEGLPAHHTHLLQLLTVGLQVMVMLHQAASLLVTQQLGGRGEALRTNTACVLCWNKF